MFQEERAHPYQHRKIFSISTFTLVAISIILSFLPVQADEIPECIRVALQDVAKKQDELKKIIINGMVDAIGSFGIKSGKLVFYPIYGPVSVALEAGRTIKKSGMGSLWRVPFRLFKKDGKVIVGAVTLKLLDSRLSIDQIDFDQETKEYEDQLGQQNYVYVDMISPEDRLAALPSYEFEKKLASSNKTFFIRAKNFEDMEKQLLKIEAGHGKIYGLEIFTHGLPGEVWYGDHPLQPVTANADGVKFQLLKGGKIKLNACLVGLGDKGDQYLQNLGKAYLPEGGVVFSSRVMINSNAIKVVLEKQNGVSPNIAWAVEKAFSMMRLSRVMGTLPEQISLSKKAGGHELGVIEQVRKTVILPVSKE